MLRHRLKGASKTTASTSICAPTCKVPGYSQYQTHPIHCYPSCLRGIQGLLTAAGLLSICFSKWVLGNLLVKQNFVRGSMAHSQFTKVHSPNKAQMVCAYGHSHIYSLCFVPKMTALTTKAFLANQQIAQTKQLREKTQTESSEYQKLNKFL